MKLLKRFITIMFLLIAGSVFAAENYIQLPPDSTGKKERTVNQTIGANDVHQPSTIIGDPTTANTVTVDSNSRIGVNINTTAKGSTAVGSPTSFALDANHQMLEVVNVGLATDGTISSTTCPGSGCVSTVVPPGSNSIVVVLVGTGWTGTMVLECDNTGAGNWVAINAVQRDVSGINQELGSWTTDFYGRSSAVGCHSTRVRATAFTAGSMAVHIHAMAGIELDRGMSDTDAPSNMFVPVVRMIPNASIITLSQDAATGTTGSAVPSKASFTAGGAAGGAGNLTGVTVKAASTAPVATDTALVITQAPNGGHPCMNPSSTLAMVAGQTSGTASVQLVALSGSTKIYVCGVTIQGISGTTPTFALRYGTGSACATGTATIIGAFTTTALATFSWGPVFVTTAGQALCYIQSGTTPISNYAITYVQQ